MSLTEGDHDGGPPIEDEEALGTVENSNGRSLAEELGDDDDDEDLGEDGDSYATGLDGSADADEAYEEYETPQQEDGDTFEDVAEATKDSGPRTPPMASLADSGSIPDDTPSAPGSYTSFPFRMAASPSVRGSLSRSPSGALQPFERRFQSKFSSPSPSRVGSPGFLGNHSRQSSLSTNIPQSNGDSEDVFEAPWEVARWTKLRKISGQAFSEVGKRQFGAPTCLAVSAFIVIGTSKGLILIFDYAQTLKHIIGQGTKATECGAITSLGLAADYSTIGAGHATGHIFTWEVDHSAQPFLHIPPVPRSESDVNSDGHVPGRAVLHIGFLGTRHTALVTADDGGMAFSHLATRGLGSLGRSVKTARLLGRYPSLRSQEDNNRKPSSVLAFAPLPLGNVEQATDSMGLTALLTPYLLVIVSTTPIAHTQHKASRPKDISPHGAVSGCLAWFPAVKLKNPVDGRDVSRSKLVYCWSDMLTVLDIETGERDTIEKDRQPSLFFNPRSRWRCEEAIVAVQWLSRSVIGVLTISQRLVILEDGDLHVMDSIDLLQRHIYHQDFFSEQLHSVVEQNEQEALMHGVIADAFFMSFRAYKGRLFLLGYSDVSVGTLSNWADRISALVENGNDIGAVRLAITYYNGSAGRVSVGLPEDTDARHDLVKDRLLELLTASLRYRVSDGGHDDGRLEELLAECFSACLTMDESAFLLDDIYEMLKDADQESEFLEILEKYIMGEEITNLPPTVVKDLVSHYVSRHQESRLEEMLCRLDAHTFDIDEITKLCKRHLLYDALIYVWNHALVDWITPLAELLALIRDRDNTNDAPDHTYEDRIDAANKIFSYLAFSLTGRIYPKGDFIDDDQADVVKNDLYKVLFSHQATAWPPGSSLIIHSRKEADEEPAFPYLHLLLEYDTASFMSMMNEAFEDPFLNANQEFDTDGPSANGTVNKITRQQIISVLLDIMTTGSEFSPEQSIYLDMFIARTLPKYSQFMILSGSSLQKVLDRLCTFESDDLADECQLSVEYLLSIYHPSVTQDFIDLLHKARFYRVLKSVYRNEQRYPDLIKTYMDDPHDKETIFSDLPRCLEVGVSARQREIVEQMICDNAATLAFIDLTQIAHILIKSAPDIVPSYLDNLNDSRLQFAFLRIFLEPNYDESGRSSTVQTSPPEELLSKFGEQYVQLMCVHDPTHVADYVRVMKSGDLELTKILPAMEQHGVIDAAVLLLAQDGLARDAMDRLVKHIESLRQALCSLIEASADAPDIESCDETAGELVDAIDKYTKLGIWLCSGQTKLAEKNRQPKAPLNPSSEISENDLDLDEYLWLTLIDLLVNISTDITSTISSLSSPSPSTAKTTTNIRALVQQVFTTLLSSTATPNLNSPTATPHPRRRLPRTNQSFLHIFRAFLTRAARSAPSLSDVRAVLIDIFSAYAYESDVLSLATSLLGKDAFVEIDSVHKLRQRGWRPRTQVCEICKLRAWGTGIGEGVWDEFLVHESERTVKKRGNDEDRGKGKEVDLSIERTEVMEQARKSGTLLVFACRHVFHRHCLNDSENTAAKDEEGRYHCPLCDERAEQV